VSTQILPLARHDDLIVQAASDELIVYDNRTGKAYVLNPSAAAVWRASNGARTVPEIAQFLSRETPADVKTVWYALAQLNDLLEEPVTLPPELSGMSRRKFLKLSGAVAAGVTAPLVVKMVAPTPAQAQSGDGGGVCCQCDIPGGGSLSFCAPTCEDCAAVCANFGAVVGGCNLSGACACG
jgi:hypothetical protein